MSCNGKIVSSETNSCDSVYVLRPGRELRIVDGKIPGNVYARLEGTEEDVAYEIVLSYPANRPAKYVLKTVDYVDNKIKDCVDREIVKGRKGTFRRLLDTEKLQLVGSTDTHVHVQILPSIVRSEFEELNVAVFNLRIEKLVYGIPSRALPLIAFCLVGLAFTFVFVTPRVVLYLLSSTVEEITKDN